jgi:FMN-dependent NADH-azoreductase
VRLGFLDHQKGYIDFWLKFIGIKEVQTLVVEGTTWPEKEKREASIAHALEAARKFAADF